MYHLNYSNPLTFTRYIFQIAIFQIAIIRDKNLSSRSVRRLVKGERTSTYTHSLFANGDLLIQSGERSLKSFDKSILALRIAIRKLGPIIEAVEDDWILYNM